MMNKLLSYASKQPIMIGLWMNRTIRLAIGLIIISAFSFALHGQAEEAHSPALNEQVNGRQVYADYYASKMAYMFTIQQELYAKQCYGPAGGKPYFATGAILESFWVSRDLPEVQKIMRDAICDSAHWDDYEHSQTVKKFAYPKEYRSGWPFLLDEDGNRVQAPIFSEVVGNERFYLVAEHVQRVEQFDAYALFLLHFLFGEEALLQRIYPMDITVVNYLWKTKPDLEKLRKLKVGLQEYERTSSTNFLDSAQVEHLME